MIGRLWRPAARFMRESARFLLLSNLADLVWPIRLVHRLGRGEETGAGYNEADIGDARGLALFPIETARAGFAFYCGVIFQS